MLCWHRRYNLGDKNPYASSQDFWDDKELQDELFVKTKVYGYDHSGMTISHVPFTCKWDSGTLGLIYATKKDVVAEYGSLNDELKPKVLKRLIAEIKEYDNYLTGNYYGFKISDEEGQLVDSCSNFSGDTMTEVLDIMKPYADAQYAHLFDKMIEQLSPTKQSGIEM